MKISILCQNGIIQKPLKTSENKEDCDKNGSMINTLKQSVKESGSLKRRRENFLKKALLIHKGKYDYSKVNYINNTTKNVIICPIHLEFLQTAHEHLDGSGCPKCAILKLPQHQAKSTEQFIAEARAIHGNKYDYSKVNYRNAHKHIVLYCPKHGGFNQRPHEHLKGQKCFECGIEERNWSNGFKWKNHTFPDGRIEKVQGYEALTIDYLISSSIDPNEIRIHRNEKPIILYEWSGSIHRYFPDCYIKNTNTIVETKSSYTWEFQKEQNLCKIKGSLNAGYNVQFITWNNKQELVSDINYILNN